MQEKDTNQEPELYGGYGPQEPAPPYNQDEMPQSSYPHPHPHPHPHPPSSAYQPSSPEKPSQPPQQEGSFPYQQQQQQYYQSPQQEGSSPYQQQQQYYQSPQQEIYIHQQYGHIISSDVGPDERTSMGMKARTAGWLCYLFGWITGLIFFLLEKENRFVRFHAMQSILFLGALSLLEALLSMLPAAVGGPVGLIWFISWIFLMVQAGKGRYYKLPIIGDLAERLANQLR